jgi:hypothetical protein
MNSKTKVVLASVLGLGLAFGAGYYSKPESTKEIVKYKEAKDVVTVVTKYVYKDGTTKEQTVIKDKSNTSIDSETETIRKGLGVRVSLYKILNEQSAYGLQLHSPPLLNIFKAQVGLSAGAEQVGGIINYNGGVYAQF